MEVFYFDKPSTKILENFEETKNKINAEIIYNHFHAIDYKEFINLKYILCPCTNIAHLGRVPYGVKVFYLNDPDYLHTNVHSTSEWTISAMYRLLRHDNKELQYKSVGIVGLGRLGSQVSEMLESKKTDLFFFDKCRFPKFHSGYIVFKDFIDLCKTVDIVSIHVTSNKETAMMFNKGVFDAIRKSGNRPYLINSARSEIVEPNSLIEAIKDNTLSGVALDVMESYGASHLMELYDLSTTHNVFISNHKAGSCIESRIATDKFVNNIFLKEINYE